MCMKNINFIAIIVVILVSSSHEDRTRTNKKVKVENIANYNENDDTDTDSDDISASEDSITEVVSYEVIRGNPKKYEDPGGAETVLTFHMESKMNYEDKSQNFKRINIPPINMMVTQSVSRTKIPVFNDSLSDGEEVMEKEILRANALRKAYGNACYRVVLRKCLKAMKATLKDVCKSRGRKCAGSFKDDFKENAITGCNTQFNNQSSQYRHRNDENFQTEAQFSDLTRQGYLSMTCLRTLSDTQEQSETKNNSKPVNVDADTKTVNILRDRYEKACQKASYEKCRAAGKYATDKTCKKYECITNKKKALTQTYKKRCKESYGYKGGSSSSSSSGGSSSGSDSSSSGSKESDSD